MIRALFTREALLASDRYQERLTVKQRRDVVPWQRHTRSLADFLASPGHRDEARRLGIPARLEQARAELERVRSPEYLRALVGTIGADPVHRPVRGRPGKPESREAATTARHAILRYALQAPYPAPRAPVIG